MEWVKVVVPQPMSFFLFLFCLKQCCYIPGVTAGTLLCACLDGVGGSGCGFSLTLVNDVSDVNSRCDFNKICKPVHGL